MYLRCLRDTELSQTLLAKLSPTAISQPDYIGRVLTEYIVKNLYIDCLIVRMSSE